MTGSINVVKLGKAYKQYHNRWGRLAEWLSPKHKVCHSLKWILRDIDFTVNAGEAVGIIGVNGAGKSTLLKMITGTTRATEGSIHISGTVAAMLELGMGFHPDFTGRQNTYMAGQLLGISSTEMASLIPKVREFADIGDYFDQSVRTYSSGMSVRLAFAVATAKRPDILIIDEALSVGDAYFQQKSFKRIRKFQSDGTTLLLVSHDIAAVRNVCDHVIWLDNGAVRLQGETKSVIDAYASSLYEKSQAIKSRNSASKPKSQKGRNNSISKRDCRQKFINTTNLRNDIKVFSFDENAECWGDGAAKVENVILTDESGTPLSWIIGGEQVLLTVEVRTLRDLESLVIGFIFKDRLGQPLFGDNTYLTTREDPVSTKSGQHAEAVFCFIMPIFPQGAYSITAAVATGTQEDHVINDWVDQAIVLDSQNCSPVSGMIGIPMNQISLNTI